MKITIRQLKQLIKEQVEAVIQIQREPTDDEVYDAISSAAENLDKDQKTEFSWEQMGIPKITNEQILTLVDEQYDNNNNNRNYIVGFNGIESRAAALGEDDETNGY